MLIVRSRNAVPVRLTEERWRHVVTRHPEMARLRDLVLATVAEPDAVLRGDFGELLAVREYEELELGRFVVVAYRESGPDDGFVLTAYLAGRVSTKRKVIWKR